MSRRDKFDSEGLSFHLLVHIPSTPQPTKLPRRVSMDELNTIRVTVRHEM